MSILSSTDHFAGLQVKVSEWRLSLWPVQLRWINSSHKGLDWQAGLENNADISADWQHNRAKCFNAIMLPLDWVYNDKWLMQKFMVLKTHFPAKCHPIYTAKQQLKLWLLTIGYVQNGADYLMNEYCIVCTRWRFSFLKIIWNKHFTLTSCCMKTIKWLLDLSST